MRIPGILDGSEGVVIGFGKNFNTEMRECGNSSNGKDFYISGTVNLNI